MTGKTKHFDIPPMDAAAIAELGPLAHALPQMEAEIRRMQGEVVRRALEAIANGSLTGEQAIQLWNEFAAQEKLFRRFNTRLRVSQSVAGKHSGKMEEKVNHG